MSRVRVAAPPDSIFRVVPEFDPQLHPRDAQGRFGQGESALGAWAKRQHEKSVASPGKVVAQAKTATPAFFDPKELKGLPEHFAQKEKTEKELFAQAATTLPMLVNMLDHGKGVDKDIGARVVHGEDKKEYGGKTSDILNEEIKKPGPVILIGGLKGAARS